MDTNTKNITFSIDGEDVLNIKIHGQIGNSLFEEGYTMQNLQDSINAQPKFKAICLEMCSPGGGLIDALNIYSTIDSFKQSGIPVSTHFSGCNASSSTIIGMVADKRTMSKTGLFLVHDGSTSIGNAKVEDLEKAAENLADLNEHVANLYAEKTGMDIKDVKKLMDEERWMNADEAKEYGFITDIEGEDEEVSEDLINAINLSNLPKIEIKKEEIKMENIIVKTLENALKNIETPEIVEIPAEITAENDEKSEIEMKYIEYQNIISAKDSQIQNYVNEITTFKSEIDKLNNIIKEKEIDNYLDEAIKKLKITSALRADYKNLLMVNFETTKSLIDKMTPQRQQTLFQKAVEPENLENKYKLTSKKPYTEMSKNDPEMLRFLFNNNFDEFNAIYFAEYGQNYER